MANIVYKALENIIPLLLAIVVLFALVYFFLKKITSPFSKVGNFLWDKTSVLFNRTAQARKNKLQNQIRNLNVKITDLEIRYNEKTKHLLDIKDRLNDLSKCFTVLNDFELQKTILDKSIGENAKIISEMKNIQTKRLFSRIKQKIKTNKLAKTIKKAGLMEQKTEENIKKHKQLIQSMIDELLLSVQKLTE